MGGRLDATNTVIPEITAITHISLEHAEILGDTVEKIAFEKAGIIKQSVPIITTNTGNVLNVIKDVAAKNGSEVIHISNGNIRTISFRDGHAAIEYSGNVYEIGIPGRCQAENAAIAIECCKRIRNVSSENIVKGLKNVVWKGRMQYFPNEKIIIDVTHTSAGAKRLADDILETYGKVILILGMFNDKSADGICDALSLIASEVIVTSPNSERAMPSAELMETMSEYHNKISIKKDVPAAIGYARGKGIVLITGSLYMAGEAMAYLRKM
jgi:dihydrofolate synthase/folylpolyglutamate synthase